MKLKPGDLPNLDLNCDFGKISKKESHGINQNLFLMARSVQFLPILF